jgi:osmotically-inducible protein OsmY
VFRALFSILVLFAVLWGIYYLYEGKELPLVGGTLGEAKTVASAKAALALHRDLSDRPITVEADGDMITLTGHVADENEKVQAEQVVRSVTGIEVVENLLEVSPDLKSAETGTERSIGQKLDDAAVGTKVRASLALHKDLKDLDLGIRVRSGTVYLEGEVESPVQAETARRWILTVDGVERVENFLRVPEAEQTDGELAERIEDALTGNENLSPYRLRAILRNGTLVLVGEVATGAESDLAEMLAERVAGGRKLKNEIRVAPR